MYVSLVTMSKVIRRFAKAWKYEQAVQAFKIVDRFGVNMDIRSLNILVDALVKGDSAETARESFLSFKDKIGFNLESFNIFIHGRVMEEKDFRGGEYTLEEIKKNVVQSYFCIELVRS